MRWQLCGWYDKDFSHTDLGMYRRWLSRKLDELERVLDDARRRQIGIIVDLHSPPGGASEDGTTRIFLESKFQEAFLESWDSIVNRVGGSPALAGWDLVNEPNQNQPSPTGLKDWRELQIEVARRIRVSDSTTPILFEVAGNSHPEKFGLLRPVDLQGIVYEVHMYWPHAFVMQGFRPPWKDTIPYPGTWQGRPFDKDAIRSILEPVRSFQLATGARILVGEFSALRWAPGASQYLADCISIFEEYGWDWTYHAFREYPGWDVEVADEPWSPHGKPIPSKPTERESVLRAGLSKNRNFPVDGSWGWSKWSAGW
ncbi:MAG: cellulase family glycosylhydrolase [Fibrobacteria bacterium]|nr:cellulase family glycosylhydrolase [Fibrobacteria bacterium]